MEDDDKGMRIKGKAIERIVTLLLKHLTLERNAAEYVAEKLFHGVVQPAVDEERNEWILLAKSAPSRPDGRGFDS